MSDFYAAYCAGDDRLTPFFAAPPKAIFESAPRTWAWDADLAGAIRTYQPGAAKSLNGDEAVIITGQQTGLFTGPLYTIYKAITAIKTAERLQRDQGVPCVPMFWIHGDDHDFAEVQTAHYVSKTHVLKSITYSPEDDVTDVPMHRMPLDNSLATAIDQLAADVTGSEFSEAIRDHLHESLAKADSIADWMRHLMARLFADTPLILFSPTLQAARRIAAEVLDRELAEPEVTTSILAEAGQKLEALGFPPALVKKNGDCHVFLEVDGRRRKLVYADGAYRVEASGNRHSIDEVRAILRAEPHRFSANVALRCIVQQRLFPVAAYVAGPGEVAYWAQFKGLFERFGLPMPIVYPRAQAVLTTIKLNKLCRKFGFTPQDLRAAPDELTDGALDHLNDNRDLAALRDKRAAVTQDLSAFFSSLGNQAGSRDRFDTMLDRMHSEFDKLEAYLRHADEAKVETVRLQLNRLCAMLAPLRKPQERVLTVYSFLFEHGFGLINRLTTELDIASFTVNEVEL